MPNILINPESGFLEFNTGSASGSAFDTSLSGAARLKFQNSGELNLTSLGTGVADKFTVDGSNGRLLTVNNTVTGSIFSVNDVAGLPIVEVFSDDRVVMGQYASDALVVSGSGVSFAHIPTVSGNPFITGFSEGDTLQTVTDRGSTTTNTIIVNKDGQGAASFNRSSAGTVNVSISAANGDSELTFMNLAAEKFTLGNDGTNNSFRIAEGGALGTNDRLVILNGGNVGIGTDSPSQLLDVSGDAAFAEYLYHQGDEDTNIKFVDDDFMINVGGATFFRATETTQNTIKLNSDSEDTDFYLYGNNATPALFMRGSDREIGINTTNPTASLHVVGNARIKGSSSDGVLTMENAAGSQSLRIDQNSLRTNTSNNLTLFTSGNGSQLVYIKVETSV